MTVPLLPPFSHRPEVPQRKLPRRWIDYLRFRKCKAFRSFALKIKGEEGMPTYYALKGEKDYALSKGMASFWSTEAFKNESKQRSGFRVRRGKFALALRVKRALKQFLKNDRVEAFLDKLRVTVQVRRSLSVKFRREQFSEAHILDLTD